jgi:hypothetical protein
VGRHGRLLGAACALAFACFPAASLADSIASDNWSGWVAHGRGVAFRSVTGSWTQPAGLCPGGYPTWSAAWVGLGGYNLGATALEQIGTELDCTVSGQAVLSAWYELIPALPVGIPITVRPGDRISASVIVADGLVTLRLADRNGRRSFSRTIRTDWIDVSSADWIMEAPSQCDQYGNCLTMPLADFGSIRLSGARAQTTAGRWGSIASPRWRRTSITLLPDPYYYALDNSAGVSTPSPLRPGGASFDVDYSTTAASAAVRSKTRHRPRTRDHRIRPRPRAGDLTLPGPGNMLGLP